MDLPETEPFEDKFEDVEIHIYKLKSIQFVDTHETQFKQSGTVGIREFGVIKHNYQEGRDLVGDLVITFRNQGNHFDSVIMSILTFRASSSFDPDGASVFAKFIQWFMDWMKEYITNNEIKDMEGEEPFVLPAYQLSKANFPLFQG